MYKLYNNNHLDVLKEMDSNYVDCIITSPPYDNLRTYDNQSDFQFEPLANELFRVLKKGGILVWIVNDSTQNGSETLTSFKQALYFKEIGFRVHDTMIYKKKSPSFPDKVRYHNVFEYMFIFSKGKPKTVNLIKDRPNKWAGSSSFGTQSNRNQEGVLIKRKKKIVPQFGIRFNVWEYHTGFGYSTKDEEAFKHPAIFPESLAKDHILSWSNEGDLILDPMCGSGTVLKQAFLNNRNFIGIEINPEYCQITKQRLLDFGLNIQIE